MDTELHIADNFFEDPDSVRNHATSLRSYHPCDFYSRKGIYSGYRTPIHNPDIERTIVSKIENLFQKKLAAVSLNFHLNPYTSMLGCPHKDNEALDKSRRPTINSGSDIAGVVYLSKNAPPETGTTLYEAPEKIEIQNFHDKMQIIYDVAIPPHNFYKKQFALEMKQYKESLTKIAGSEHVYNTLIIYSSRILHAPGLYFGDTLENSRLTIPIHASFEK
jgi:hypothetical protein